MPEVAEKSNFFNHNAKSYNAEYAENAGGRREKQLLHVFAGSGTPRRSLAACTVLAMSMAMVSGPTPPGTGVMAPATSATWGWTSPTSTATFGTKSLFPFGIAGEQALELGAVGDFVHADIDDGGARFHKIAGDHCRRGRWRRPECRRGGRRRGDRGFWSGKR